MATQVKDKLQAKIFVVGKDPIEYVGDAGEQVTILQAIRTVGLTLDDQRTSVRLNGKPAQLNDLIQDNDQIVLSQNIRGGIAKIEITRS